MCALQCGAAVAVMAVYLFVPSGSATTDAKASMMLMLTFTIPMLMLAALPPYVAAVVTWWLATAFGRGPIREVAGIVSGALVGSLVPLFILRGALWQNPDLILGLWSSIAVCSALGFACWVAVAWRRAPAQPEHSLN
jgi:hypothetical protein